MAGAKLIKLFPAGTVGPDYVKHIRGPLPHLKIVVTGGVQSNVESIKNGWKLVYLPRVSEASFFLRP